MELLTSLFRGDGGPDTTRRFRDRGRSNGWRVDSVLQQEACHVQCVVRVSDQDRNDGADGIGGPKPQRLQSPVKVVSVLPEPGSSVWLRAENVERRERGGGGCRWRGGGEQERSGGAQQVANQTGRSCDVSPAGAECLPQRSHVEGEA